MIEVVDSLGDVGDDVALALDGTDAAANLGLAQILIALDEPGAALQRLDDQRLGGQALAHRRQLARDRQQHGRRRGLDGDRGSVDLRRHARVAENRPVG